MKATRGADVKVECSFRRKALVYGLFVEGASNVTGHARNIGVWHVFSDSPFHQNYACRNPRSG